MTTTNNELGTKPEASMISFDPSCFVADGYTTSYLVGNGNGNSYPARFSSLDAAEKYAARRNQSVQIETSIKWKRVKWTM